MTEHLKRLSAETALNNMMSGSHFSICAVRDAAKLLGVNPKGDAYDILHPLHCIDWDKMPAELRDAVPSLIEQCIGMTPSYVFRLGGRQQARHIVDITPAVEALPQPRGFLRLLGGRK
ncbi:hypothetical protein ABIC89_001009 [Variovorax boronicumulans]|uniref:hypothetical protein n=1 Tax=Variovorax boronicumulans TaxID=436515 RepID=UPI00339A6016